MKPQAQQDVFSDQIGLVADARAKSLHIEKWNIDGRVEILHRRPGAYVIETVS